MSDCPSCGAANPEPARFCMSCGAALEAQPSEPFRRTVTVLFSDVVGSTALGERLDPEIVTALMTEYFEAMKPVVELHGGSVAKFIGDAVMAVFGIPTLHEDDALRAVRAALAMRGRLDELNADFERRFRVSIATRTAINTGQVAGTGLLPDQDFVGGDTSNLAARLQQAAAGGEILLSPATHRVVRGAVEAERLPGIELKGKGEPVAPYRLLGVVEGAEAVPRRLTGPMIGRVRERRRLADAWEQVTADRVCHVFTVLGAAGVGKSRLSEDFLSTVDGARVARGRCLSYGEGITFWPLVEILVQLLGEHPRERLAELAVEPKAAGHVAALLGEGDETASLDELFWAVRTVLEAEASRQPLVLLLDDLHWAEPALLDLVEHVADWSRGVPMLLLCLARPELLDRRSTWGGGKLNATSLLLEPLDRESCERLLDSLGDHAEATVRARVLDAADGNPLFLEEMVGMLQDAHADRAGEVAVPVTIQALLAARLDQLPPAERAVLERGAVEGQVFHRGSLGALLAGNGELDGSLRTLVRKELLRPEPPQLPGEHAFRFRHLLIRDAAYEGLPKRTRAQLHERFADWLAGHGGALVERDELVAYHCEQALRYRAELGLADDDGALAARTGELLASAGRRALARGDIAGSENLLQRAARILPRLSPQRVRALLDLGLLGELGQFSAAREALEEARDDARGLGRDDLEIRAEVELLFLRSITETEYSTDEQEALARRAIEVLERHDDHEGLARAWFLLMSARWSQDRWDSMRAPLERSIEHARRAGSRSMEMSALTYLLVSMGYGSTPVEEGLRLVRGVLQEIPDSLELQALVYRMEGVLLGFQGRTTEARELLERSRTIYREMGSTINLAVLAFATGPLEERAGDVRAAEREYRTALEALQAIGERGRVTNLAALLAQTLLDQGRLDEAEHYVRLCRDGVQPADVSGQAFWRIAAAGLHARHGDFDQAVRLAGESVAIMQQAEDTLSHGYVLLRQAMVLEMAGREAEAAAALRDAIELYRLKGSTAEVERAAGRLAELEGATPGTAPPV